MDLLRRLLVICVFALSSLGHLPATDCWGQKLPRKNVVDIPAIGEGLCVSNVFQSNMVLQRDKPNKIWGWASPNESVSVSWGDFTATTQAAEDRSWSMTLPAQPANSKPQTMTIKGQNTTLELINILIGDVWLLGGQSNMEFELAKVENGPLEIVSANYPEIRILTVPYGIGPENRPSFPRLFEWSGWFGRHFRKGDWDVCSPAVAKELSAIGFVFARRIHTASRVPIGVIDASRGGTTVETWTPLPVLREMTSLTTQEVLAKFDREAEEWDAAADLKARVAQHQKWLARMEKEKKPVPEDRRAEPVDLRPGPIGNHNFPGHCYAGMLSPLKGLSIKGAIFHQGYNNAFNGSRGVEMYADVFPEMIKAWRATFADPELPFGILSLCTDGYPQTREDYCEKMYNAGIDLRAEQYQTFLNLYKSGDKNIGFVSTYDLRRRWYHPQLKLPAGERMARWALATQYGFERQLEWKPPMLVEMKRQENSIILKMDRQVGDPEDGAMEGFAIAGEKPGIPPSQSGLPGKRKGQPGACAIR